MRIILIWRNMLSRLAVGVDELVLERPLVCFPFIAGYRLNMVVRPRSCWYNSREIPQAGLWNPNRGFRI